MSKRGADKVREREVAGSVPVAAYVRMSTDYQKYSIANQMDALLRYAKRNHMQVVKTYKDEGKSGLTIRERRGLTSLIDDVDSGVANFRAVLVYDVSRWGRFQDTDESAYYEFLCKKSGVAVHYCAEQFDNDDKALSSIIKNLKRAMAGEYSRELSVKVLEGLKRTARRGYRAGGPAGFGMRRLLIDENGNPKQILESGEQKNIRSDRVILIPGPDKEQATVRKIFRLFIDQGMSTHAIAKELNDEIHITGKSTEWSPGTILNILQNEKYMGNNVYNRRSHKMKGPYVMNPPEDWIRVNNAFEPIVSKTLFRNAQKLIKKQRRSMDNEDMLSELRKLYKKKGYLDGHLIDKDRNTPSANTYIERFKSLYAAYALVGFNHNNKGYSSEQLLVQLATLFKKNGYLSTKLIDDCPDMPGRNIYCRRFGSVHNAYKRVGYNPGKYRLPEKVMLERLKKLLKTHGRLSETIIDSSEESPRSATYRKVFGSLLTVYSMIGYDPDAGKVSNEELVNNLRSIYKKHGYLSGTLIDQSEFPHSRGIYHQRFGTLSRAYAKVDYYTETYGISNAVMIDKLRKLYREKGYLSRRIIDQNKELPCAQTYCNRFGGLQNVYKLVGFLKTDGP